MCVPGCYLMLKISIDGKRKRGHLRHAHSVNMVVVGRLKAASFEMQRKQKRG